jgi:hypothetical protein
MDALMYDGSIEQIEGVFGVAQHRSFQVFADREQARLVDDDFDSVFLYGRCEDEATPFVFGGIFTQEVVAQGYDVFVVGIDVGGAGFDHFFEVLPFFADALVFGIAALVVLGDEAVEGEHQGLDFIATALADALPVHADWRLLLILQIRCLLRGAKVVS